MNLEVYKQEIFRRSKQRIKKRKKIRNRVLALSIPLTILGAALLITPPLAERKDLSVQEETIADTENYSTGSIFCSFVQAELYVDGKTVTVTDKLTVDRLYMIADADQKVSHRFLYYGSSPAAEPESATEAVADQQIAADESKQHIILFTAADGSTKVYPLTEEQYKDILGVLE